VRKNRIDVVLRKDGDGDVWFDLYKKRAIGDDSPRG